MYSCIDFFLRMVVIVVVEIIFRFFKLVGEKIIIKTNNFTGMYAAMLILNVNPVKYVVQKKCNCGLSTEVHFEKLFELFYHKIHPGHVI